ncbi:hypothetical protein GEMRC1_013741 [Eukaryota sp. GEM-RC1]
MTSELSSDQLYFELSDHTLHLQSLLKENGINFPQFSFRHDFSDNEHEKSRPVTNLDLILSNAALRQLIRSQTELIDKQSTLLKAELDLNDNSSYSDIIYVVHEESKLLHSEISSLRSSFETELEVSRNSLTDFKTSLAEAQSHISMLEEELESSSKLCDEMTYVAQSLQESLDRITQQSPSPRKVRVSPGKVSDWKSRAIAAERKLENQAAEFKEKVLELAEVHHELQSSNQSLLEENTQLKKNSNSSNFVDPGSSQQVHELSKQLNESELNLRKTFGELRRAVKMLTDEEESNRKLRENLYSCRKALALSIRLLSVPPQKSALFMQAMVVVSLFEAAKMLVSHRPELVSQGEEELRREEENEGKSQSFDRDRLSRLKQKREARRK